MSPDFSEITPLGYTNFRHKRELFGIKPDDRRRHVYVIGKTGMGKTTLLENMVIADLRAGRGVAVVDPHGEFAEDILNYVPSNRVHDVVYFNPADYEFPIAFNVVEQVPPERRHLIASGLVGVFKKIWADSWGPRLEYILRNTILSLLEYPGATLLDIMRMLGVDKEFRNRVVQSINDPVLKSFWVDEFAKFNQQFQVEAVSPIQNKVGQFLTAPLIRNIVGQRHSAINIREIMDNKQILILNLSKGRIGEDNSALLGAMMITKIQLAAMERVDILEYERQDFYLYVDEFQNFATDSFANILSEARKYRLNLTLAHQYIEQLDKERSTKVVRDAVFGNVGTIISFRVGADDAEFLEREFEPCFTANDLVNLAKYNAYLKLMIDGLASEPFSAETMPTLPLEEPSNRDLIINYSRQRCATSRQEVEEYISQAYGGLEVPESKPPASVISSNAVNSPSSQSSSMKNSKESNSVRSSSGATPVNVPPRTKYFATCWKCGETISVPFKPDGKRPVFCKDCFKKARALKEAGRIAAVSAYVGYDEKAKTRSQERPPSGFAVLKELVDSRAQTKAPSPPVVTHKVTQPVERPNASEEAKKMQADKRGELKSLLSDTLREIGRDKPESDTQEMTENAKKKSADTAEVKPKPQMSKASASKKAAASLKDKEKKKQVSVKKSAVSSKKGKVLKPGSIVRPKALKR